MRIGAAIGLLATLAVAACSLLPPVGGSEFIDGTEGVGAIGYFHGVGDPTQAQATVRVGSFGNDGIPSEVTHNFSTGDTIDFEGVGYVGSRGILVDGQECEGSIPIEQERVTEVVLHLGNGPCRVTVIGLHPVVAE
jgi:hypothetical protein